MAAVLKEANAHFARTRRLIKEKSNSRDAQRYQELLKKCSFSGEDSGFTYHPLFRGGEHLYQASTTPRVHAAYAINALKSSACMHQCGPLTF
ncbi:unnamed protein product [Discosporangium mesarthrocarpum]